MNSFRSRLGLVTLAGMLGLAIAAPGASAAGYPERPIILSNGFGAGGSADITARVFATFLEKYLPPGARVINENKPGADGGVNNRDIAMQKPDGYRLGWFITPAAISAMHERDVGYKVDSFTYIGQLMVDYNVIVVAAVSPYKTLGDMIEYGRANPGKVTIGITGFNGPYIDARELFRQAGVEINWVPFSGGGELSTSLMGGHVSASVIGLPAALGNSAQRALAIFSEQRLPGMPNTGTVRESGYDIVGHNERGVVAPGGLPDDVRTILVEAVRKVAADPEYTASLAKQTVFPAYLGPDEYRRRMHEMYDRFGAIWARTPWMVK